MHRLTSIVVLLGSTVFAQTAAPVKLTVANGVTATNISPKEIVLVTVMVSSKSTTPIGTITNPDYPAAHDYYFKAGGMAPGDINEVVHPSSDTITSAKPSFVQFADGTTWGDNSELQDPQSATQMLMATRKPIRDLFDGAILAYQSQGEQSFLDYLTKSKGMPNTQGFASRYLQIQKDSGTAAAVSSMQKRLNAAKARPF